MARVKFTSHLRTHFPQLGVGALDMGGETVADVIQHIEALAPGFAFYVCDELGRLRRHVNIFVDEEMIMDRRRLSDPLNPQSKVFIAQALSGG